MPSDIDTSYFVLTVDLWNAAGSEEVNLVKHSLTSPAISATTAVSYPPNPETDALPVAPPPSYTPTSINAQMQMAPAYSQPSQHMQYPPPYSQPPQQIQMPSIYSQAQQPVYSNPPIYPTPYHQPQAYVQQQVSQGFAPPPIPTSQPLPPQNYYPITSMTPTPITPAGPLIPGQGPLLSPGALSTTPSCDPRSNPSGMYTRNLIGSLCVSAFKLTDPDNNLGVWFILQDLSVRTEGAFR